ncbi:MAG TPA: sensor histidine kinase, partial [Cytophagales bacterium]|nr:sensor histidine kinase [Cytophagales bacterium]
EYFYLALFYGVVISLFLYNLFIYLYLKDSTYIYYTTYIGFAGLWAMSNDGLGFQYIWYNCPSINKVIFPISNFLMITFLALYARKFFETSKRLPLFDRVLVILLAIRAVPYLIWVLDIFNLNSYVDKYFLLDSIVVMFLLCIGIEKINIRKHARIYVLAFTFLLLSYIIFAASYFSWIKYSLFTLYSINFGIAANMIILAMGLVSRLRSSIQEADVANKQILYNLREKELLKDEHNRQLELKVLQRTQELIAKNEELNSFVYRASHDIKGPISSLIGLAKIGQIEQNPEILKEYFKHVLSSSEKLDKTLSDLLQLSHVSEADVKNEESNLGNLLNEVLNILKLDEKFNGVKIETEVTDQNVFVDERMLKPILHNLVENSLKYSDPDKPNPFVKISIYIIDAQIYINILDNGIGIPEDYQNRVFEKFFRVGVKGSGSGLGLHIVQRCIEKLNGKIELVSTVRLGTSVTVILPM